LHNSRREKVSGTFCRNGPKGASHKRCLTPFPGITQAYIDSTASEGHRTVCLCDCRVNSSGWLFSAAVEQVVDGKNGVLQYHPRASVAHHPFDAQSHRRLVAVNGAVGARRLVGTGRTTIKTVDGVCQQLGAVRAEPFKGFVVGSAVDPNQGSDRAFLAGDSRRLVDGWVIWTHGSSTPS